MVLCSHLGYPVWNYSRISSIAFSPSGVILTQERSSKSWVCKAVGSLGTKAWFSYDRYDRWKKFIWSLRSLRSLRKKFSDHMETTLPAIEAKMIAEIELLLSQWPLSLRSLRWLQSLERDALPTLVPEYKVSTLFLGTGTGPNSVEGSWSKGVFTLASGSTTGKFATVENFNYLYAKPWQNIYRLLRFVSTHHTSLLLVKTPSFKDSGAIHRTGSRPTMGLVLYNN